MSTSEYLEKCEQNYDADCRMLRGVMGPGHYHSNIEPGTTVHHVLSGLGYGSALLRAGGAERHDRAEKVIAKVLTFQNADPTSGTYGVWPIFREEPLDAMPIPDCNLADFGGSALVRGSRRVRTSTGIRSRSDGRTVVTSSVTAPASK